MIREYGPIFLIPAAWITTLIVMFMDFSAYWVQHMHYFMLVFLVGFTVLSWNKMKEDPVLDIWRKVIAFGVVFTLFGALSFHFTGYSKFLGSLSMFYWLIAPGIGCYRSAFYMKENSESYRVVGFAGTLALFLVTLGLISGRNIGVIVGILLATVSQSYSILVAAKMDGTI